MGANHTMTRMLKKYLPEILGGALCLSLGLLSGLFSQGANSQWYIDLSKPKIMPPNWVFAPVWTVLYVLMGVALGKIWKQRVNNKPLLWLFALQLLLNIVWSPLFFYYRQINFALLDLFMLWVCLLTFMAHARSLRTVYLLFIPYILWVSFALALNYSISRLNVTITV